MPKLIDRRSLSRGRGVLVAFALLVPFAASCARQAPALSEADLIQPDSLARVLADSTATRPVLLHVGFAPLYRSGHIPGSKYMGAGSKPEGLAQLKQYLSTVPADRPVVLYCGCCPWTDCPNVRPAFRTAKETGHANVRVLYITGHFETDWTDQGLPTAKGEN